MNTVRCGMDHGYVWSRAGYTASLNKENVICEELDLTRESFWKIVIYKMGVAVADCNLLTNISYLIN